MRTKQSKIYGNYALVKITSSKYAIICGVDAHGNFSSMFAFKYPLDAIQQFQNWNGESNPEGEWEYLIIVRKSTDLEQKPATYMDLMRNAMASGKSNLPPNINPQDL